jgi:hypothetical protein
MSWNTSIAPNSAVEMGMQMAYQGSKPLPTNALVPGQACTISVVTSR